MKKLIGAATALLCFSVLLTSPARADDAWGSTPCYAATAAWQLEWQNLNDWVLQRWGYLNATFNSQVGRVLGPRGVMNVVHNACLRYPNATLQQAVDWSWNLFSTGGW
jgi:hypothetical protein